MADANTEVDKRVLLDALEESIAFLRGKVAGVPDRAASQRPSPERWSILENLEHILIVDGRMRARIASTAPMADKMEFPEREKQILLTIPLRESRVPAPAVVCPQGRFTTIREALDEIGESVRQDQALVQERLAELRYVPVQHPLLGTLSGFEGVLLLAGHIRRHANQIHEVKEQLGLTND